MGEGKVTRLRITYYDEERSPDVVRVGLWEAHLAEEKFGPGCLQEGRIGALLYVAFLGARRAGLVLPADAAFEAWGQSVALVEEIEPGESPAPPAT